jgi:hypothetical protein
VFVPQPVVVYIPVPVPVPVLVAAAPPPPVFPVVMPQRMTPFIPEVQNTLLPALGQVLPTEPLQEVPLQIVPVQPAAPLPGAFLLAHPLLFCELDAADTCEDLADELDAITPGFDTILADGPNGYGVYLMYQPDVPALEQALASAPVQEIAMGDGSSIEVQVVLYCDDEATSTCENLADQLADIDANFGTLVLDGPQGYGVYLTYLRPD